MLYPLTIFTKNNDSLEPIEGVDVAIWDEHYSNHLGGGLTDASGEFAIGLDSGTYKLFLLKDGITFYPQPKTIGIDSDPIDIMCRGTVVPLPALPADYVYLFGTLKNITLNPVKIPVYIHLNGTPQIKAGAVLDRSTLTVCPDATGYWSVLLAGGTRITVSIPACQLQRTGMLPFAGALEVNDLGVFGV